MTLSDEEVQNLQLGLKSKVREKPGKIIRYYINEEERYFQIVNSMDATTQAIAFVPVDDQKGNNPNYQETTIVVAGTQIPFEHLKYFDEQGYFWKKDFDITFSFSNAIDSTVFGLTAQAKDIDKFYLDTQQKIKSKDKNGVISNMSGHSQAGPGVAYTASKYGLKENRTIKVTNFMDFAAKKAVDTGGISKEQVAYLNKNATIYRDSRRDVVNLDGNGGAVPYGKTMMFEVVGDEDGHSPRTPHMKGNTLDIDWYYKHNRFASGMTEKQVRKIAEYKTKKILDYYKIKGNYNLPEYYVKKYLDNYGPFAPEPTKQDLISLNIKQIKELKDSLKTSSGSKKISLREELVRVSAETTKLQAEVYEEKIKSKIESEKEKVSQKISSLKTEAYSIARHLPSSEVEVLLSELSLDIAWNSVKESNTTSAASDYKNKMSQISDNLNKVADRIIESDQIGAKIFSN
ncbi:hypothetical protein [Streptococcus sp. HMSC076C09]|uniref:hypothetical protein n=1 Tax=Streptococcus sp. HMSC076C09 TaxID=1715183 RepID=UPI0008A93AC0|nr:hypothetical protein [Streptococcus sp. HMSC076C09]OHQ90011.1 hypothetical protein HMPREF2704_04285 [Streptococcus sp. HMSC076C09]